MVHFHLGDGRVIQKNINSSFCVGHYVIYDKESYMITDVIHDLDENITIVNLLKIDK